VKGPGRQAGIGVARNIVLKLRHSFETVSPDVAMMIPGRRDHFLRVRFRFPFDF
jgi:hypothetical protein